MMVNLRMISFGAKEHILGLMENNVVVIDYIIKCMVKVSVNPKMEKFFRKVFGNMGIYLMKRKSRNIMKNRRRNDNIFVCRKNLRNNFLKLKITVSKMNFNIENIKNYNFYQKLKFSIYSNS